jgi:hypothetical protein
MYYITLAYIGINILIKELVDFCLTCQFNKGTVRFPYFMASYG